MVHSYATIEDFEISGLPEKAYGSVLKATVQRILQRASALADTYLRDRYTLPLCCKCGRACGFDPALVDAVCGLAAYRVVVLRGYNPDLGADQVVRQGYDDALALLKRVANGQQQLQVCQSVPESQQPDVHSNAPRGYGAFGQFPGSQDRPVVGRTGGWGTIIAHEETGLSATFLHGTAMDDLLPHSRRIRQAICGSDLIRGASCPS